MAPTNTEFTTATAPWWFVAVLVGGLTVLGTGMGAIITSRANKASDKREISLEMLKMERDRRQRWDAIILPAVVAFLASIDKQLDNFETSLTKLKVIYGDPPYPKNLTKLALKKGRWRHFSPLHMLPFSLQSKL